MRRRERIILGAALTAALLYLADLFLISPLLERWDRVSTRLRETEQALADGNRLLTREAETFRRWRSIEERISAPDPAATTQAILVHMSELDRRAGVSMDLTFAPERRRGDFNEIPLDVRLQTTVEGLRNLLVELHNSEEHLKLTRLSVVSQPEDKSRSDRLDVDLRLSTIEYAPSTNGKRKP